MFLLHPRPDLQEEQHGGELYNKHWSQEVPVNVQALSLALKHTHEHCIPHPQDQ